MDGFIYGRERDRHKRERQTEKIDLPDEERQTSRE